MWSFFSRDPTKDFPYEIGEGIEWGSDRTFWRLHKGKKKGTGQEVTIFILDSKNASVAEVEGAKAAVKRLKTLRHPSILTFLDSVESEKAVYLATEYVEPLEVHLSQKTFEEPSQKDLFISWGLFQITRAVSFLVNDGNLRHNNVHIGSVFVNGAGEWKLGGVEFVTGNDQQGPGQVFTGKVPVTLHQLDPPEVSASSPGGGGGDGGPKWSRDSWGLGILIWEVFNGRLAQKLSLSNPGKVPKSLLVTFNELVSQKASSRPNPADVIVRGRRPGGFFKNDLADSLLFLEEIQIKEQNDKTKFFSGLSNALDKFPPEICKGKILPQLINAFEFGNAGSSVLTPLFKLGKLLDEPEYQAKIVPCIVKLFASPDRATRVKLLQQLEHISDHLQPGTVNDKIFPNVVTGFVDTNPTVREQTVKAMLYLSPKLNYNNLNVELLKHFARLQIRDEQGGIRTNTTICLGKISCYLNPQTRRKVLIPAFTRVFQDTFPQARIAGIIAIAATQQYYPLSEISTKVIPAMSPLTIDPEKSVRDTAFKTIKGFLGKLEKVSEDPSLKEKLEADIDTSTPTTGDSASSWAGWAVSALTSKFNRTQSQTSAATGQIGQLPTSSSATARPKGNRIQFGGQSSSSTSTTTSSIPSTPSGERDILQPTAEGQESTTDYDDDWDNGDWGSIDGEDTQGTEAAGSRSSSSNPTESQSKVGSAHAQSPTRVMRAEGQGHLGSHGPGSSSKNDNDGWDDWGGDEEKEEKDAWESQDDFVPESKTDAKTCSIGWGQPLDKSNDSEFFDSLGGAGKSSSHLVKNHVGSEWGNADWTKNNSFAASTETSSTTTAMADDRAEELKKRREERKLHRQQEMETKKPSKSGPLKLGAKKIQL